MEGGLFFMFFMFFFGICVGVSVVMFGQAAVDSETAGRCAKKHNVYACEKVETWEPKAPAN